MLEPGRIRDTGFTDVTAYRADLPAVYNEYRLVQGERDDERERLVSIFMPLYGTSWLLADWLNEIDFGGAAQLVASSASSKTALGLGHALQVDFDSPIETVGLTSPGNVEFTRGTGHWDAVVSYALNDHLDLRLNAYNLFDKDYVAAINKSGYRYTPGAPRSVLLTLNLRF